MDTNTYRNRWTGHGGAISTQEATLRLHQLHDKLQDYRHLFGNIFAQYELIRTGNPVVLPGPVYEYPIERVMGSNPMLERQFIQLIEPAVSGQLYFYSRGQQSALELYPFIQVQETPQIACYFFNRIDKSIPYYVAYHPVSVSEIKDFGLF